MLWTVSSMGPLVADRYFRTIVAWQALAIALASASSSRVPLWSVSWNFAGTVDPSLNTLIGWVAVGSLIGCWNAAIAYPAGTRTCRETRATGEPLQLTVWPVKVWVVEQPAPSLTVNVAG